MPEVVVRKRLGRRSGGVKYQLDRWFYRNRPKIAVAVAFLAACVIGLATAAVGVGSLSAGSSQAETPAAPNP